MFINCSLKKSTLQKSLQSKSTSNSIHQRNQCLFSAREQRSQKWYSCLASFDWPFPLSFSGIRMWCWWWCKTSLLPFLKPPPGPPDSQQNPCSTLSPSQLIQQQQYQLESHNSQQENHSMRGNPRSVPVSLSLTQISYGVRDNAEDSRSTVRNDGPRRHAAG